MLPTPDAEATAERFILVTQIYFCAMYAVVLWDWITSLHREYLFIWRTHWTPVKMAYLFCRYWVIAVVPYLLYCFVGDHSLVKCQKIYRIPVGLAMWNQVGSQIILLIRTYAFFNKNVYILAFLLSALSGVIAYQLYVDVSQMLREYFHSLSLLMSEGLAYPCQNLTLYTFSLAPLMFDTLVTAMCVGKAVSIRRQHGASNKLIQTFIREGVFYCILISIANLINGIFYLQPRQALSAINIPLSVMLGPILACRLVLDLRQRGSETVSESVGTAAFTTKSISQQSPFTPPGRPRKRRSGCRHEISTYNSNIMLTTLGSIPPDRELLEEDLAEMDQIAFGPHADIGSLSTAIGGDDGEPMVDGTSHHDATPTPTYSLEAGFCAPPAQPNQGRDVRAVNTDAQLSPV